MLPAAIEVLDQLAVDENILDERGRPNRSEVVRMLCREALAARARR
jgi:metal-responsive CopG/Arc/MetJ family transcriptional regulator